MLSKMRDHRKNRVLQVIVYSMFAIIIIVFAISFGPGSWGQGGLQSNTQAANVNGTIISSMELERAYGMYLEDFRRQTGESLSGEQAEAMGIKRQILDSLIERQLVVQQAAGMGIQVPDAEVSRTLREIEAFQTDGRFDQELFERYVRNYLGSSTGRFFERVREDMVFQRVVQAVRSGVNVSSTEVWNRFVEENDKVDLEYVRFSPVQFRETISPTDDQIDELLAERPDEVEAYYERNSFRYEKPERVRARHILIGTGPEASDSERDAARQKAEELLAQIREGADFAELAEEHSDDPGSAARGGDLDWFPRGQMVPAFEETAFSLSPGEISDVVETPFGYHLILVEEKQDEEKQELEDVSREIAADILKSEQAMDAARRRAEEILEKALAGRGLTEVVEDASAEASPQPVEAILDGAMDAEEQAAAIERQITRVASGASNDLSVATTGLAPIRGSDITGIGRSHELAAKIRALPEETMLVDEVVEIGGAFYVVGLIERQRPDPDAFEAVKEQLRAELLRARQGQVEEAFLESLRDEANIRVNDALVASM